MKLTSCTTFTKLHKPKRRWRKGSILNTRKLSTRWKIVYSSQWFKGESVVDTEILLRILYPLNYVFSVKDADYEEDTDSDANSPYEIYLSSGFGDLIALFMNDTRSQVPRYSNMGLTQELQPLKLMPEVASQVLQPQIRFLVEMKPLRALNIIPLTRIRIF